MQSTRKISRDIFDIASNSKEILKGKGELRQTGRMMMYVLIVLRAAARKKRWRRRKRGRSTGHVVSTFSTIFTCVRTVERLSNSEFYSGDGTEGSGPYHRAGTPATACLHASRWMKVAPRKSGGGG